MHDSPSALPALVEVTMLGVRATPGCTVRFICVHRLFSLHAISHLFPSHVFAACSTTTGLGRGTVATLEDMVFPTWDRFDIHLGEPLLLAACLSQSEPNGSACTAVAWTFESVQSVRNKFKKRLKFMCKKADSLEVAWRPVTLRTGAAVTGGVWDIAMRLLDDFIAQHTVNGLVCLPFVAIRSPADIMIRHALTPEPDLEFVMQTRRVAAVRVQLPVVPAAVRTSASMLSATVRPKGQRVVVHSTSAADTTLDATAHNAPMYIGLTRVSDTSDVAVTNDSIIHDNMFQTRQPLANLAEEVQRLDEGRGCCNLYHCYAQGHQGDAPLWRGGEAFDARLHSQAACGFFSWSQQEEDAVVLAYQALQAEAAAV